MHKIFTLSLLFVMAVGSACAQQLDKTFRFVDKDGKEIANGSTVPITQIDTDLFGLPIIHSGLFVENTTNAEASLSVDYDITALPSGAISFCFPSECNIYEQPKKGNSGAGDMKAQKSASLALEWMPLPEDDSVPKISNGQAKVSLTLQVLTKTKNTPPYAYAPKATGPTVHLIFDYKDPTGLAAAPQHSSASSLYNLSGQRVQRQAPYKGIYIVRTADGRTQKVLR